jgi:hypothetical protein
MGTQLKGPFGGFSGKTGGLIGAISKGRSIITSLHTPSSKAPTKKQIDQRFKFGMVTSLLAYISDLIDIGFQEHKVSESAMNAAVAYNLKYAVTGVSPDFSINLPQLSFSRGKLIGPKSIAAEALAGAKVKFTWTASEDVRKLTNPADLLMIMVYNSEKTEFITGINAASRSALTYTIQLPVDFTGDEVHAYVAFAGIEGKVSDSIYAGVVSII